MNKITIGIGDHVWWGDPASPFTGKIITMSQNGMFSFILLDNTKKPFYATVDTDKLHKLEATQ